MIRISKLTDYGILVLTALMEAGPVAVSASELAGRTAVPEPTVGKILRRLTRAGILTSTRGARGGYSLARAAEAISVAEIIEAFEGPIALTECLSSETPTCDVEPICTTRANWDRINRAIRRALEEIPLAEMARPQTGWRARLGTALVTDQTEHREGATQ